MKKALELLELQKDSLGVNNIDEFGFIVTNRLHKLVPYHRALFWNGTKNQVSLNCVSGNAQLDHKSPYATWIKAMIKKYATSGELRFLEESKLEKTDLLTWRKHNLSHVLLMPFENPRDGMIGGIWIERDDVYNDAEIIILQEIQPILTHALTLHHLRKSKSLFSKIKHLSYYKKLILLSFIILALLPVRLSITAPAEIISESPLLITPGFDGVIQDVLVKPGEYVSEDDILIKMESHDLQTQKRAAEQDLKGAQSKLARLQREALFEAEKKIELEEIKANISLKSIELKYAEEKLKKTEIRAPQTGTVIFSDSTSLIGQPISVGQELMQIADIDEVELLIRIPVDTMIAIDQSTPASFYMNATPLKSYDSSITSIGYQASIDPDGLLTYKVRAKLPYGLIPRIGWKGTAKLYGDQSILAYALLRRPLVALRNIIGF